MKKRNRKILYIFIILITFFIVGVGAYKIYNSYEYTSGGITITTESNDIKLDSKYKYFFMELSIDADVNKEILDRGIAYKIINPNGSIEEEGMLSSKDTIKNGYNDSKGIWKIEFDLTNDENIMINFKVTSSILKSNL